MSAWTLGLAATPLRKGTWRGSFQGLQGEIWDTWIVSPAFHTMQAQAHHCFKLI